MVRRGLFYIKPALIKEHEKHFIDSIGYSISDNTHYHHEYELFVLVDKSATFATFIIMDESGEQVIIHEGLTSNPKLRFLEDILYSWRCHKVSVLSSSTAFRDRYYIGCEAITVMYDSGDDYFFNVDTEMTLNEFMTYAEKDGAEEVEVDDFIDVVGQSIAFDKINPKEVLVKESNNKIKITESKEEKEMGVIKGFEFGVVGGDRVRLSHLGVAVKNKLGEFVAYDKAKGELINVDLIDLGIDNMIYKMPVAIKEIVVGDVIFHGNVPMVIKKVREDKKLVAIDPYDAEEKVIIPIKNMFGFDFATKVVSMIDFSNLGANEKSPFGNMLPLLLMSKGDGKGMSDMLPLMMLSQGGGAFDMSNPMMMMMMLGDKKGGMSDILPLMMMSGMNSFGAKPVEKPTE